jgi:hypothetical protein
MNQKKQFPDPICVCGDASSAHDEQGCGVDGCGCKKFREKQAQKTTGHSPLPLESSLKSTTHCECDLCKRGRRFHQNTEALPEAEREWMRGFYDSVHEWESEVNMEDAAGYPTRSDGNTLKNRLPELEAENARLRQVLSILRDTAPICEHGLESPKFCAAMEEATKATALAPAAGKEAGKL